MSSSLPGSSAATASSSPSPSTHFYGFKETDDVKRVAVANLEDAINMLPADARAAYVEAKQKCPALIERESSPIDYIRFHKYNPWTASTSICHYWKLRKHVFGPERAFLPLLDLTGRGALSPTEIKEFDQGVLAILPNNLHEKSVAFLDRSRNITASEKPNFLIWQMLCQNICQNSSKADGSKTTDNSAGAGVGAPVILVRVVTIHSASFNRKLARLARELSDCLPMQPPDIHVICCAPPSGESFFRERIIPFALGRLGKFFSKYATTHVVDSNREAMTKLAAHGFAAEGLPTLLGGSLDDVDVTDWQRKLGRVKFPERYQQRQSLHKKLARDALERYTLQRDSKEECESHDNKGSTDILHHLNTMKSTHGSSLEAVLGASSSMVGMDKNGPMGSPLVSLLETQHQALSVMPRGALDDVGRMPLFGAAQDEARQQVKAAMRCLPDAEKTEYVEATMRASVLLERERESDPLFFLYDADGHLKNSPLHAAKMLALYWKHRRALFGDRAFLPLSLSGKGALSDDDLTVLHTGVFQLLPNDKQGRPVIFQDRALIKTLGSSYGSIEARLRCLFYVLSVAAKDDNARTKGLVLISTWHDNAEYVNHADSDLMRQEAALLRCGAIPGVRVHACHFVCCTEDQSFASAVSRSAIEHFGSLGCRLSFHTQSSPSHVAPRLRDQGFRYEGLPSSIGGGWGARELRQSMKDRLREEDSTYQTQAISLMLDAVPIPLSQKDSNGNRGMYRKRQNCSPGQFEGFRRKIARKGPASEKADPAIQRARPAVA